MTETVSENEIRPISHSARFLLIICGPMIWIGNQLFRRRLNTRKRDVAFENASILKEMWSLRMLTSRSVIVIAKK